MEFKLINIKPCDSTFFGDGYQFNFDISNIIKSKNTPYPSVFFGAIFTAILTNNDEFRRGFFQKSEYDHENILEIGQVYLFNEKTNRVYIKAPMDLFINSKGKIVLGKFQKHDIEFNSLNHDYILESPKDRDFKRIENMYINTRNIYDGYLKRQEIRLDLKDENKIFIKNYKVGIGIDKNSKNVEDGKLYKIQQTEFANDEKNEWSYIVEYKINRKYLQEKYKRIELKDLDLGYLKLGGENKACKFKAINNKDIEKFNSEKMKNFNDNIYKIIFTSESYFLEKTDSFFKKNNITILGMSNSKPIYIGGYDMKDKRTKGGAIRKMYKGYSPGTVFLIKSNKEIEIKTIYEFFKNGNKKGFNNCVILKEEL
ncbi:CRISPR-associated protein Cmr3 [Clostridium botulinum]|uniref:type III-B CRISPR module-associated Cmr3 family protein n=1 Tax=Clostridium botulinum TaxID=1491 RepID=UPI0007E1E32A|nr:type III-B CRISPR module-associated Cmr3 family protein [Clostridium botulinum]KEI87409.1 hypothetical protein N492_10500 [Clostridium botulinum B2 267]MBY6799944.1 CRISPR-associated protein Cmr3 [Clostridium botulinum]NFC29688.1 CRISPR-associated protein Cmr3 [Clostridium botulinum]NFC61455.1 CRISPR-associated protein Cmr3 [Clostridium botulinum]NFC68291.1 CRISPR-associated protein Cmr3 [Clostridium botulinum]